MKLQVVVRSSGEVNASLVSYEVSIPEPPQLRIVASDTANVNEAVLFNASGSSLRDHRISRYYWSFGDGFFNEGPVVSHSFRKPGKYIVELWVIAVHEPSEEAKKYKITKTINISTLN